MSNENFICTEHVVPSQHIRHYSRGTSQSQEDELLLAVKQYTPRYGRTAQTGDVTILACHASGFPKELYEPLWDQLFRQTAGKAHGPKIRSIWIADVVNQNASGVLNEHKIGTEPSYYDHARDLLCLVNHFRKDMPRPIVGFGHSMGGTVMINLAILHPRLLTALFTVEPVINKTLAEMNFQGAFGLAFKKDVWPSRSEAEAALRKSPIVRTWDASVLALYLRYGLRDTPTLLCDTPGSVTLTTTKHQEVFSYVRAAFPRSGLPLSSFAPSRARHTDLDRRRHPSTNAFYLPASTQTFAQLPFLAPPLFVLTGSKTHMAAGNERGRQDKLGVVGTGVGGSGGHAEGRVVSHVLEGGNHFVPFEKPAQVADLAIDWWTGELERWEHEELLEVQETAALDPRQRASMDEDWKWWIQEQYGSKVRPNKARL